MTSKPNNIMKIICLGNVATGKTCIVRRYVTNEFSHQYRTTIGVDFVLKEIDINGTPIKVQFWDLAGQERFSGLTRPYYRNSGGAMVVFDLTSRETFDAVVNWKRDIDSKVELPNGQKLPVLLIGNKLDLLTKEAQCVSDEQIEQVVKEYGFFKFAKVSAMTGDNLHHVVSELTHEVARRTAIKPNQQQNNNNPTQSNQPQQSNQNTSSSAASRPNAITLDQPQQQEPSGGCC